MFNINCSNYEALCKYVVTRVVRYLNVDQQTICHTNTRCFPDYGCCLVYSEIYGCFPCKVMSITLVALDNWEFNIEETTALPFSSVCTSHAFLSAGRVKANKKTIFETTLSNFISKASSQKGHHRTPGFILSIIQETLKIINIKSKIPERYEAKPLGGFTDVGMHTCLEPRRTLWPLAKAVLRYVMCTSMTKYQDGSMIAHRSNSTLFDECMCLLHLEWSKDIIDNIKSSKKYTIEEVDKALENLEESVRIYDEILKNYHGCDDLVDLSMDSRAYEERCVQLRNALNDAVKDVDETLAHSFQLTTDLIHSELQVEFCSPQLSISFGLEATSTCDLAEARARARKNIGLISMLSPTASIDDAISFANSISCDTPESCQYMLYKIEKLVFSWMLQLNSNEELIITSIFKNTSDSASRLESVVEKYRNVMHAFMSKEESRARMRTNLASQEILVCLSAFCLIFSFTKRMYPLVKEYNIALSIEDLKHLVIKGSYEELVLKELFIYIQRNSAGIGKIFDLCHQSVTLDLGEKYAKANLRRIRSNIQDEAEAKTDERWKVIQTKKKELLSLRDRLRVAQKNLKSAEESLESAKKICNAERRLAQADFDRCNVEVNSLNRSIESTKIAPPFLIHPLPSSNIQALLLAHAT